MLKCTSINYKECNILLSFYIIKGNLFKVASFGKILTQLYVYSECISMSAHFDQTHNYIKLTEIAKQTEEKIPNKETSELHFPTEKLNTFDPLLQVPHACY